MSERTGTAADARMGTTPLEPQSEAPQPVPCLTCDSPKALQLCPVPLFAVLTALIFRSRPMHYPKHLTFALHAHSFLFLALIPTLVPRILPRTNMGGLVGAIAVLVSFGAIATHLVLALRRVYGGTLRGAITRSAVLAGSYFVLFTIALLTTVAIVMAVQF